MELCTNNFLDLKLTGMQGDVMKESMNVAKTLSWNLLDLDTITNIQNQVEKSKLQDM